MLTIKLIHNSHGGARTLKEETATAKKVPRAEINHDPRRNSGEGKGVHTTHDQRAFSTPLETRIKNKIPIADRPLEQEGRGEIATPGVLDTT